MDNGTKNIPDVTKTNHDDSKNNYDDRKTTKTTKKTNGLKNLFVKIWKEIVLKHLEMS